MGVVKRQGIKESIVAYFGVIIGAISLLIIQPYCLEPQEIGMIKMLIALASLMTPFVVLGMNASMIKFFPEFKNPDENHYGLVSFILTVPIIGFILLAIGFLTFQGHLAEYYTTQKENSLIVAYLPYALPLALCMAYILILKDISRSTLKVVVPSIVQNIWLRAATIIGVVLYFYEVINFSTLIGCIVIIYGISVLIMLLYIRHLGMLHLKPDRRFYKKEKLKEVGNYAFYVLFIGLSGYIVNYIDILMIGAVEGESQAGIYTIAFFIGTVIEIPRRSLSSITTPLVSQAFNDNNMSQIKYLYSNVSINLLIIGSILLIGIWSNIDNLFMLMPNGEIYAAGKYIVLLIGLAKLFNMATSINGEIILLSPFYRFNLYAMVLLTTLTVASNAYFIPIYGIIGAAVASLITVIIFNLFKLIYLWLKLKMQPFNLATVKVLVLSAFVIFVNYLIPNMGHPLLDIVIRSILLGSIYLGVLLLTKISPDINSVVGNLWNRVKPS
jgi:O-antigen/teichoic acid export membrane protein